MMNKDSSAEGCLDVKELEATFDKLHDEEIKYWKKSFVMNRDDHKNMITFSSVDSAAQKAGISREKYLALRQEFLKSYKFTVKESLGKKTKKWFKDNKPQNPLRFIVMCVAPKASSSLE